MDEENLELMDITEGQPHKKRDPWTMLITAQIICTAIILAAVLIIQTVSKGLYKNIKKWYDNNLVPETTVSEVLEGLYGESDEV